MTLAVISCAQMANCPVCWVTPGWPCGTGWDHLGRYGRAYRRGLVSEAELSLAGQLAVKVTGVKIVWHADAQFI